MVDIAALFWHVLSTTYFQWNRGFYKQIDRVVMGSPLDPVVVNFYMEKFKELAIRSCQHLSQSVGPDM